MTSWFDFPIIGNFGVYPDPEGLFPKPDINIIAPSGTAFTAPASGVITGIDTTDSYGDVITVRFDSPPNRVATHYAFLHLSSIASGLSVGQRVSPGTVLGHGGGGQSKSGADPGFAFSAGDLYGHGTGWANNVVGTWINPLLNPTSFYTSLKSNGIPTSSGTTSTTTSSSGSILPSLPSIYQILGLPSQQDLTNYFHQFIVVFFGLMILLIGILVLFFAGEKKEVS